MERTLERLLALVKKQAPGAEGRMTIRTRRVANTRFARSEITSTGDVDDSNISLALAIGKRQATASTDQVDDASLRALVDTVAQLAKLSPEDPEQLPVLGPQKLLPPLRAAHDEATARLGAEARAAAAAAAIAAGDAAGLEVAGFYEHAAQTDVVATTAGFRGRHAFTRASLSMTCRTPDGSGSGWAGAWSPAASGLDPGAMARVAAAKAVKSAKPRRLEPGKYVVVLEAAAVAELLDFMTGAMDRRAADEGRSFFSRARVGDKLFPEAITLTSDPADPAAPGQPFTAEGLPVRAMTWIDKGTIAALPCSRYWAQKQGVEPLAMTQTHLHGGAAASVDELVAGVKRGVLITRFWYTRSLDPRALMVTGLTRDGVFLVEDGVVTSPVNNFRFNDSPVNMLAHCDAMTKQTFLTAWGSARSPALRTAEFNLASISEAV